MGASKAQQAKTATRRADAVRRRLDGQNLQEIADALDYDSAASVATDIRRALAQARDDLTLTTAELRQAEDARLNILWRAALEVMTRQHVLVSGTDIVRNPETDEPMLDDAPVLKAVDRLLRISQRRAALHGLDAPAKIHAGVTVKYEVPGVDPKDMP